MDILENKYVYTILTIFIILYASKIGPNLPNFIRNLFNNALFRVAILFLIVVRANKDPVMSMLIAVGFVLTINFISEKEIKETFSEMPINTNEIPIIQEEEQSNEVETTGVMTCGL